MSDFLKRGREFHEDEPPNIFTAGLIHFRNEMASYIDDAPLECGPVVRASHEESNRMSDIVERPDNAPASYDAVVRGYKDMRRLCREAHDGWSDERRELWRSLDENARLRAALTKIAENDTDRLPMYTPQAMQAIARAALDG